MGRFPFLETVDGRLPLMVRKPAHEQKHRSCQSRSANVVVPPHAPPFWLGGDEDQNTEKAGRGSNQENSLFDYHAN